MKTFPAAKVSDYLTLSMLMLVGAGAHAAGPLDVTFAATAQSAKQKRSSASQKTPAKVKKVQFLRGSEESAAERNARLKRECKGGVNAGACAGFTR